MRGLLHTTSCATVALLVLLLPAGSRGDPGLVLQQARTQYQEQEYERVVGLLQRQLNAGSVTVQQRVAMLELLGLSQLILGREQQARRCFTDLFRLDPVHRLNDPSGSPKLSRFFEEVRRSQAPAPSRTRPTVTLQTPGPLRAGERATFVADSTGATTLHRAVFHWRRADEVTWHRVAMEHKQQRFEARIRLPDASSSYRLALYLELFEADGSLAVSQGSSAGPLLIDVAASRSRGASSLLKKWWFWTAVGVVVAGGVTAAVLATSKETAPGGSLSPGVIRLRLNPL